MIAPLSLSCRPVGIPSMLWDQEKTLYGCFDPVRQITKAAIRRYVNHHRDLLSGRVLDYGAGKPGTCPTPEPYRDLIRADIYVGWDVGDPAIPEGSRIFDGILCTQVIQNVEDAQELFGKFRGWLKPGGHLVLTYPVAWPEIERECWRFTQHGAWVLCHKAGLQVVEHQCLAEIKVEGFGPVALVNGLVAA